MVRLSVTSTLLVSGALFAAPVASLAQSTANTAVNETAMTTADAVDDGLNASTNTGAVDTVAAPRDDDDDDDKDFPWGLLGLLGLGGLLGRKRRDDDIHVDARREAR